MPLETRKKIQVLDQTEDKDVSENNGWMISRNGQSSWRWS